eukprot:652376-Rhodomonas_salina.18
MLLGKQHVRHISAGFYHLRAMLFKCLPECTVSGQDTARLISKSEILFSAVIPKVQLDQADMSGDGSYLELGVTVDGEALMEVSSAICLSACYVMPCTDIANGASGFRRE